MKETEPVWEMLLLCNRLPEQGPWGISQRTLPCEVGELGALCGKAERAGKGLRKSTPQNNCP